MQQAVILLMMQKESNLKPNFDNLSKTINTLGIELGNVIKQQAGTKNFNLVEEISCLLYTSPSPRDDATSRMPSSA